MLVEQSFKGTQKAPGTKTAACSLESRTNLDMQKNNINSKVQALILEE